MFKWSKSLPIVVITVAAKMTALGQFQLLKALSPVMVTPCPAASDTTYLKMKQTDENSHTFNLNTVWHQERLFSREACGYVLSETRAYILSCKWYYQQPPENADEPAISRTWVGHTSNICFSTMDLSSDQAKKSKRYSEQGLIHPLITDKIICWVQLLYRKMLT